MTPDQIVSLFTAPDGRYHFARWQRAVAPVVFGLSDETLGVMKAGLQAMMQVAGHALAETDPEQGANLMIFFFRDWSEVLAVPDLAALVPGLPDLVTKLDAQGADQYRQFRFEADGAIRACFAFYRVSGPLGQMAAADLALLIGLQVVLDWPEGALQAFPPLALADGRAVLRPEMAALVRAAYDPTLSAAAHDASHGLRLAARLR